MSSWVPLRRRDLRPCVGAAAGAAERVCFSEQQAVPDAAPTGGRVRVAERVCFSEQQAAPDTGA